MIIGYARVSTEEQELKLQHDALNKYGVDGIVSEKASGGDMHRKTFSMLLEHGIRKGDTVVVWKLDRLGRDLSGVLRAIERFEEVGVNLVSITDGFDARTPMGKAMMQISLVFAELERNLISERTKAGMAAAKAEGKTFGRKHSIRDFPKRIKALQKLEDAGELKTEDGILLKSPTYLVNLLNEKDKNAPPIKNVETIRRWKREGFPWIETRTH